MSPSPVIGCTHWTISSPNAFLSVPFFIHVLYMYLRVGRQCANNAYLSFNWANVYWNVSSHFRFVLAMSWSITSIMSQFLFTRISNSATNDSFILHHSLLTTLSPWVLEIPDWYLSLAFVIQYCPSFLNQKAWWDNIVKGKQMFFVSLVKFL